MTGFVAYSTETTCWGNTQTTPVDDPRSRYVNEPGLIGLLPGQQWKKLRC